MTNAENRPINPTKIASPNQSARPAGMRPRVIVVHTTESHERAGSARGVAANWFALQKSKVSAHYVVDPKEVVQCVDDARMAWHAGKANGWSIGVELCGRAGQTPDQWQDADSQAMLARAAELVGHLCHVHGITPERLTDARLKAGESGIVGHADVSRVYGGTHWDPGPNFPWDAWLASVREACGRCGA